MSSLEFNISTGSSDLDAIFAVPVEPSDEPHRQSEQTAEPAQTPRDANVKVPPHASHSVGDLCNTIYTSAEDNDLPVPFFANLIWQESELQLNSVSSAGALGIAQFMPEVAVEVGLRNPFDPHEALPASARFLRALRQQFGNLGFVAAAYNAGAHRVADWLDHDRALPQETRTYVLRVTGRSAEAWRKSPLADFGPDVRQASALPAFAGLRRFGAGAGSARTRIVRTRESAIRKNAGNACIDKACIDKARVNKACVDKARADSRREEGRAESNQDDRVEACAKIRKGRQEKCKGRAADRERRAED